MTQSHGGNWGDPIPDGAPTGPPASAFEPPQAPAQPPAAAPAFAPPSTPDPAAAAAQAHATPSYSVTPPANNAPIRPQALKPAVIPFRPLTFFELLEGTFKALRVNPKPMFGSGFLGMAIIAIALVPFVGVGAIGTPLESFLGGQSNAGLGATIVAMGYGILWALFAFYIFWIVCAVQALCVGQAVLGRKPTLKWLLKNIKKKLLGILGGTIVTFIVLVAIYAGVMVGTGRVIGSIGPTGDPTGLLLLGLALMAIYLVAMITGMMTCFSPSIVGLEETPALRSVFRSIALFARNFWRNTGVSLGLNIIIGIVVSILITPIMFVMMIVFIGLGFAVESADGGDAFIAVGGLVAYFAAILCSYAVSLPFMTSAWTVHYLDARIRTEGFDAELSATVTGQEVGQDLSAQATNAHLHHWGSGKG